MAGNVYKWCQDWYRKDYYSRSPAKNPLGPDSRLQNDPSLPSTGRVVRSGSFASTNLRVAFRNDGWHFILDSPLYGFRCVSGLNFTPGSSAGEGFTSGESAPSNEEVPLPLAGLAVGGTASYLNGEMVGNGISIKVTNLTQGLNQVSQIDNSGKYSVTFAVTNELATVAKVSDILNFSADDLDQSQYTITGSDLTRGSVTFNLKIDPTPTLTSVSPERGSTKGDTLLTLKGTNFFSATTKSK